MIALQAPVSSLLMFNAVLIISVCLHAISACMPITQLLKFIASPTRFQATCEESNLCTLSWQRPPMYYRRQGTLLNYFINCSTVHRRDESATNIMLSSTSVTLHVWLQPYQFYNCCVAAVNEAGKGNSACQTIITHEAGTPHYYQYAHYMKFLLNIQLQQLSLPTLKCINSILHLLSSHGVLHLPSIRMVSYKATLLSLL